MADRRGKPVVTMATAKGAAWEQIALAPGTTSTEVRSRYDA
jgi:hypothetical protein